MSLWNLNLKCHRDPVCPLCLCDLLPSIARIRWGIAICSTCDKHVTHENMCACMLAMVDLTQRGDVSESAGVTLFTPREAWTLKISPVFAYRSRVTAGDSRLLAGIFGPIE